MTKQKAALSARLSVSLPGIDPATAKILLDDAQQICPDSKALRNNVEVKVRLVEDVV